MEWYTVVFPGRFKFVQATSPQEASRIATKTMGRKPIRVRPMTPGAQPIVEVSS